MAQNQNNRKIVMTQVTLPSQANIAGNVHGGEIMKLMDTAAAAAGVKYARSNVVTARVDELMFLKPVMIGSLITCTAEVVYVGNTTMEVLVTTEVEDLRSEDGPEVALTGYFTIVAMGEDRRPRKIQPFVPDTEEEWQLYREAEERRKLYRDKLLQSKK